MEEVKLFFFTYFAALLGVFPPGLVNMTVAKTCVNKGRQSGLFVAFGSTLIVFFQALIAILLAKYIFTHPYVRTILMRAGLVIFIILAIYFFVKARGDSSQEIKASKKNKTKSFIKGCTIALLNVFPIPYFVLLSTLFNAKGDSNYSFLSIILFSVAAALGSFSMLYIYIISFMKIEKHTQKFAKYSNYIMAGLMLVLVIIALIRMYLT